MNEIRIKKPGDSIGGPTTFMNNLVRELEKEDFPFSFIKKFSKVFFFPISADINEIERVKATGGKIIQRLDGVYYPEKHGDGYIDLNKEIKEIYIKYTDLAVFQSNYSREQCFHMFGEKKDYEIIINGADSNIFYPSSKKFDKNRVVFVTTGNFNNNDMLIPIISALDNVRDQLGEFVLKIIGPLSLNDTDSYNRDYVECLGPKNIEEIADLLRSSDVFIYSKLNPPCPNSVVEAVSCALPVVGFDSGSMKELCFFNREILAETPEKVFHEYDDLSSKLLSEKILKSVEEFDQLKEKSLQNHKNLTMTKCARQYMDVFYRYSKKHCRGGRGFYNLIKFKFIDFLSNRNVKHL